MYILAMFLYTFSDFIGALEDELDAGKRYIVSFVKCNDDLVCLPIRAMSPLVHV